MKHSAIRNALAALLLPCLVTAASRREDRDQRYQKRQQEQQRRQLLEDLPEGFLLQQQEGLSANNNNVALSEQLKKDLLQNYDRGSFPWEEIWEQSRTISSTGESIVKGLDVEMGLNFHKIFEVDVTKSVVDFVVWVRLQWNDPRLVWDPSDYGNITETFFWIGDGSGSGGETSEIWTPDIQLWNLETELSETLVDIHAKAQSDGTVFWSRPGRLRPVCKFGGLNDFPFDTLQCTMEFGSWAYSGKYLRPTKYGEDGYSIGGSDTAGEAYAEFSLAGVEVEEKIYPPYPAAPSEDWPVLMYHIDFKRAWKPYMRGFVAVQILLNVVGFATFWLPVTCGERMGLAITAVLAAVASDLVVSAHLPNTNELTWINKFMIGSSGFAFAVIFQCTIVIYFFYYTADSLKPTWFKWFRRTPSNQKFHVPDGQDIMSSVRKIQSEQRIDWLKWFRRKPSQKAAPVKRDSTEPMEDQGGEIVFNSDQDDSDGEEESSSELEDKYEYNRDCSRGSLITSSQGSSRREDLRRSRRASRSLMVRDANDFKNKSERDNNKKWQTLASHIDEACKVLFPSTFVVFLAIMFGIASKSE